MFTIINLLEQLASKEASKDLTVYCLTIWCFLVLIGSSFKIFSEFIKDYDEAKNYTGLKYNISFYGDLIIKVSKIAGVITVIPCIAFIYHSFVSL